jgi:serine/threonine protein kinase
MPSADGPRARLSPEAWRRIGAVLDRLGDLDPGRRLEALAEACQAEGVRVEEVEPFVAAPGRSEAFLERLDPATLEGALRALATEAPSPPLAPGDRLGPYEVVAPLGAGGMGEVYQARDTRLGRTVALKRLLADLAASAEGRQRFEREARVIAGLNHPHICTLYDVGRQDGVDFLVMELVEGETLEARLQRGALPVADALRHGVETAEALDAAHRQGIVHRDLKPANVMLTPHGVKLLDFGLAALRLPREPVEVTAEATLTAEGTILGTLQYMAPEQLQGKPADERADIFSLGAILYEMITGRRAFAADSRAGVVAAVLERDPRPMTALRPGVTPALEWAVQRCLARAPEQRWKAADLADHLRWIGASPPTGQGRRSRRRRILLWGLPAVAAAVIAAVTFIPTWPRRAPAVPYRFAIPPPEGMLHESLFALSPEGRRLAFTAADPRGRPALWIQPLDALSPQRVAGTDGARYPFWSPDGREVGFFADDKLKRVELASGNVKTICDAGPGGGGAWNADGVILFGAHATTSPTTMQRVAASGVSPTAVTRPSKGTMIHAWPHFLPDGRHYLYMRLEPGEESGVFVGRLGSDEHTPIMTAVLPRGANLQGLLHEIDRLPTRATYAAGHLFYVRERALMAQPFDVTRLKLAGPPVRLADAVEQTSPGRSAFDVSATGVLAYRAPRSLGSSQLTWFDRAGRAMALVGDPGPYEGFELSRDGRLLLAGPRPLVRIDVGQGTATPVSESGLFPVWSPDATRYARRGPSGPFVHIAPADGSDPIGTPVRWGLNAWPGDWSSDGRVIVGTALRTETSSADLWVMDLASGDASFPVASRFDESDPRLSPDGRWLAYAATDEWERWDVYVRPFAGPGGVWRVSRGGGRYPRWTADGRELLYVSLEGTLMRAALHPGTSLGLAKGVPLFRHPALVPHHEALKPSPYSVAPDGRFLVRVPLGSPPPTPITVLLNWPSVVKP